MSQEKTDSGITYLPPEQGGVVRFPATLEVSEIVVSMKLLQQEQLDTLTANSVGVHFNAFIAALTLEIGVAVTLLSEGFKVEYSPYIKLFLVVCGMLTAYLGFQARKEYKDLEGRKATIKANAPTMKVQMPKIGEDSSTIP